MAVNKVAFTAVGLACIAAAGVGRYFALRQNAAPGATQISASAPTTDPAPAPAVSEKPVQETEAVVAPDRDAKPPKKVVAPPAAVKAPAQQPVAPASASVPAPAPEAGAPPPARSETVA